MLSLSTFHVLSLMLSLCTSQASSENVMHFLVLQNWAGFGSAKIRIAINQTKGNPNHFPICISRPGNTKQGPWLVNITCGSWIHINFHPSGAPLLIISPLDWICHSYHCTACLFIMEVQTQKFRLEKFWDWNTSNDVQTHATRIWMHIFSVNIPKIKSNSNQHTAIVSV